MQTVPFETIRAKYPDKFLVLIDYEERELPSGEFEILSAKRFEAYEGGMEMFDAYRNLKKKGERVLFCTPDYKDRFIIERRPSMRILG